MSNKLTKAQFRVLRAAMNDGSIIVGGIDATHNIRRDVITRLSLLGLLKFKAPRSLNEESEWVLTDAGRKVFNDLQRTTDA